jgi:hypothetical protein
MIGIHRIKNMSNSCGQQLDRAAQQGERYQRVGVVGVGELVGRGSGMGGGMGEGLAMFAPCSCHVTARVLPCSCPVLAMLVSCHVFAMLLTCSSVKSLTKGVPLKGPWWVYSEW